MKKTKDRELIIWDGNRLSMPTQRQFHAAVQEVRGHRMMTVPSAAREMAPLMRPDAPDRGRAAIVEEIQDRRRRGQGRTGIDNILNAEVQLWWLDEWARPDGLYGVRELTDAEQDRYEKFMQHVPVAGFTGATDDRDALRALPDAQIVCETLAVDGHLLLTHDPNTIKPERLLPWTRRLAEAGWISQPKVVEEADDANVRWVEETPDDMLLASIVCAWPKETDAPPGDMKENIDKLIDRLATAGLERTSTELRDLVKSTNDLHELIERTSRALPVEMRNSERRSPYRGWTGREERARGVGFQIVWTGATIRLTHRSLNGNEHRWGEWRRNELNEMEVFLAQRNILVQGLPAPSASADGGFASGMSRMIDGLEHSRG